MAKFTAQLEVHGHRAVLHSSQDNQVVHSSLPEPDPDWKYTDQQGHAHYRKDKKYPTLEWVITDTYYCHECRDEHEDGEYRCRICGEVIKPGTRAPRPVVIPGLVHHELTVYGDAGESFEWEMAGENRQWERVAMSIDVNGPVGTYVAVS